MRLHICMKIAAKRFTLYVCHYNVCSIIFAEKISDRNNPLQVVETLQYFRFPPEAPQTVFKMAPGLPLTDTHSTAGNICITADSQFDRKILLDRHSLLRCEIQGKIRYTETALPKNTSHEIPALQDCLVRKAAFRSSGHGKRRLAAVFAAGRFCICLSETVLTNAADVYHGFYRGFYR